MSQRRDKLIEDLVSDLRPVRKPGHIGLATAVWLAISLSYSTLIVYATGPWREGAFAALLTEPMFAFETVLAITVVVMLARAGLRSTIPGLDPTRELVWPAALLGAWAAVYIVGLWYPAHPVSTLGAREHCIWQAVLFSLPNFALMVGIARRFLPLWPRTTGLVAGAAAAAIPGALMQFGCMYVPSHILTHHLGPIAIVALIGVLAGPFALAQRGRVPRGRMERVH